jgi:hypothetical protein
VNERGHYGSSNADDQDDDQERRRGGALPVVLVVGIAAAIYGFSPGARHWYKYGRLPPSESLVFAARRRT